MEINRHNYETYFLLYVDKELCAADRKAVEVFVQENPDLEMELLLLQQTIVNHDDVVLDKKEWLYRESTPTALQENLLLYADDELTTTDKKAVEALLSTDKNAQQELQLIQQTKLQPDKDIVFADKHLLYRKETGKLVGFKWWRLAAAAIFIGFMLVTGIVLYKNNFSNKNEPVNWVNNNQVDNRPQSPAPANSIDSVAVAKAVTFASENKNLSNKSAAKFPAPVVGKDVFVDQKNHDVPGSLNKATAKQNGVSKPSNNLPRPYFENINSNLSNQTTVANVLTENKPVNRVSGNTNEVGLVTPKEADGNKANTNLMGSNTNQPVVAIQVVNQATAADENNNRYLIVDEKNQKRTSLSGLIRKAKRVLERNTNVNSGDGLKIASFEIALK